MAIKFLIIVVKLCHSYVMAMSCSYVIHVICLNLCRVCPLGLSLVLWLESLSQVRLMTSRFYVRPGDQNELLKGWEPIP